MSKHDLLRTIVSFPLEHPEVLTAIKQLVPKFISVVNPHQCVTNSEVVAAEIKMGDTETTLEITLEWGSAYTIENFAEIKSFFADDTVTVITLHDGTIFEIRFAKMDS